jgi:leader peptidase (prepilin peptidase)/N-methyltransferase|tara:strand:+ start:321 stop:1196 length:876 start_codon:yes stop_codon:yes gene_type:complete
VYTFVEFFQNNLTIYLSSVFLIGLVVGSFLNVVIIRLPIILEAGWKKECCELLEIKKNEINSDKVFNLIFPSSHCPLCKYKIKISQNIPIFSYLLLKGKCKNCRKDISPRYPIIELTSAVLACFTAFIFGVSLQAFFAICLTWSLIVLSVIDFDTRYLPDNITLPLLWFGILISTFNIFTDINSSIFGAIFGYGILWTINFFFKIITGKVGMGHGDFKLLAVFGAWFGWQNLAPVLILSSAIGIFVALILIFNKSYDKNKGIPFGPYLAFSGWLSMIVGGYVISAYLNFII